MAIVWFGLIVLAGVGIMGCAPEHAEKPEYPVSREVPLDERHKFFEVTIDGCQYLTAYDVNGSLSAVTHKGNCKNHPGLRSKGE